MPVVVVIAIRAGRSRYTAGIVWTAGIEIVLQAVFQRGGLPGRSHRSDVGIIWQHVGARAPAGAIVLPGAGLRRTGIAGAIAPP